jgi:hypothetical protein
VKTKLKVLQSLADFAVIWFSLAIPGAFEFPPSLNGRHSLHFIKPIPFLTKLYFTSLPVFDAVFAVFSTLTN